MTALANKETNIEVEMCSHRASNGKRNGMIMAVTVVANIKVSVVKLDSAQVLMIAIHTKMITSSRRRA